jgi:Protein of unknown function (DUF3237)
MVHLAHDRLELWYGTADAPAPDGTTEPRQGVTVTVGVRPPSPSNAVVVRYRIDGRNVGTVSAPLLSHDPAKGIQHFRATFPTFWSGERVEYLPLVTCDGRHAPDPATAATFPSGFGLADTGALPATATAAGSPGTTAPTRFPVDLEHLVHVRATLVREPELIGETPAGFVVNWPPASGTLDGPAFTARVLSGGEHRTVVRPDGIGVLTVSVTIETLDRALISLVYSGTVDYGVDWSARLRRGDWPAVLPVCSHIRLLTADPRYGWLNRLDCLGVGEVRPRDYLYLYDMYAIR